MMINNGVYQNFGGARVSCMIMASASGAEQKESGEKTVKKHQNAPKQNELF